MDQVDIDIVVNVFNEKPSWCTVLVLPKLN
jgi:hypothetical protein